MLSCARLFHNPMDCSLPGSFCSMGFSRQEYWSGLPHPPPGNLPHPGIKPMTPALADTFFTTEPPGKPICIYLTCVSRSVVSDSLRPHGLQPARLLCLWNSPGKNTGVDCHSLLQRNFQTQGLNSGLLHCREVLYCLSYR